MLRKLGPVGYLDKGEKGLLQTGGVSGVLAGLIMIPAFFSFILAQRPGGAGSAEQALQDAITYRTAFIIGASLFFAASLLAIPLFLSLHRVLREANLAYASLGSILGALSSIISAVAISVWTLTTLGLADVYAKGSATDKQVVVTFNQFFSYQDASLIGGFLAAVVFTSAVAIIALGAAILKSISFKKFYGWMSVAFGIIFILLGVTGSFFPGFFFSRLFLIIWSALIGLKIYNLSKVP